MKRGLIAWDRETWPEEEFRQRIEQIKGAMRRNGLDAVLIYGDANQSGDLAYLTHFIPYADTGVFALPIQARPKLFTTHAYRNLPWFETITWIDDIICTNNLGGECADYLSLLNVPNPRIGAVPAQSFPYPVARAVEKRLSCQIIDFTDPYEEIRVVKSDRELSSISTAADIALDSFSGLVSELRPGISGFDIAAELERAARSKGAEDLFCFIEADGASDGLSLPNAKPIFQHASIEIVVEYNGYWTRLGRTVVLDASLITLGNRLGQFTNAYLKCLDHWRPGHTIRSLCQELSSRWKGPVHIQVDYGLEPYWGTYAFKNECAEGTFRDNMALYLQASTILRGGLRLLRTDTIVLKDSKPGLITAL
jgi:Xaa-Pro aminopeptidase